MHKFLSLLILLLLAVGCTGQTDSLITPTTAAQPAGATSSGMVTPATSAATQPQPAATNPGATQPLPTETAAPSNPDANPSVASTSEIVQSSGSLSVKIFSDADVEVNQSQYPVAGSAPAGTVISINDDVIVVDQSQTFTDLVSLDEGPNLIEIVASDDAGQEVTFQLTITYNP